MKFGKLSEYLRVVMESVHFVCVLHYIATKAALGIIWSIFPSSRFIKGAVSLEKMFGCD